MPACRAGLRPDLHAGGLSRSAFGRARGAL